MTVEPQPSITITIVLHNSGDELHACLDAIAGLVESGFAELIAVDNASPDVSALIVERTIPCARIVVSSTNLGFAGGVNLARPHVRGRYWLLLNPDVVIPSNGLRSLVEWMDRHPSIAIASPEIVQSDGTPSSAGRALPSISRALLELTRLHRLLPARLRARLLRGAYWLGGDQLDAGWVPATAMILRCSTVPPDGLADATFMYGEDLEWCWRARQNGWDVGVCAGVTVVHAGASSARRTWGADKAQRQMARGVYEAVSRMRGRRYASLYMRTEAVALYVESLRPRRQRARRERMRIVSRAWFAAPRSSTAVGRGRRR